MSRNRLILILAIVLALLIGGATWLRLYTYERWETDIGRPGFDDPVRALAVFDHGRGPMLYAGGFFLEAGGRSAARLARWDGQAWSSLGAAINGPVRAFAVFDDGRGEALYVAGQFTQIRGLPANHIARYDGESWSLLGSGVNDWIVALAVHDDGSGPALYATGAFTEAGCEPANHIARWDGERWSALGDGLDDVGYALTVFDDGRENGPGLYVGGGFTTAGGSHAPHIARWDGEAWSALAEGTNHDIAALQSASDGNAPRLYVGGRFTAAGEVEAAHIAAWDGRTWMPVGEGTDREVTALAVVGTSRTAGSAHRLYAAGRFRRAGDVDASRIARWDDGQWIALGGGVNDWVGALLADAANDPAASTYTIYVAGSFSRAGWRQSNNIAAWRGRRPTADSR